MEWLNVAFLRMNTLMGRGAVLVEFWDFARVNSLRTMPYLKAWHERYADAGLRVIGIHSPGYSFGRDRDTVARAVERLEVRLPGAARPRARGLARCTATRAGRGATCSTAPASSSTSTTARASTSTPSWRSRSALGEHDASRSRRCGPRTPRACCWSRRPPTSPCRPTATGSSWCATGPTARTGSRPPTPARRRASASAAARPTRCCRAPASSRGSTRSDGTVEAESPGLRLHGVQFTPAPPAPGGSPSGA